MGLLCVPNLPAQAEVCYSVVTERQRGREAGRVQSAARAGAHLAALCALAFAQPLFDILGKNAEFFAVRGSTPSDIVLFALAVTFVPAAALLLIEVAVGLVSKRAAVVLHYVFLAALAAVFGAQALKRSGVDGTTVLIAGDDADAKSTLAGVITSGGLNAIDAGPLERARELESIGFLQIPLAASEKIAWTGGFGVAA